MLAVRDLWIDIAGDNVVCVESLDIRDGERLGLVGESGSGKTLTAMAAAGLAPSVAAVRGSIKVAGREVVGLADKQLANIRGRDIGVIFQDPQKALNPVMRIGRQVAEAVRLGGERSRRSVGDRVVQLLGDVHLPDPGTLVRRYPHQLSGGQQQRVLIAIAIARRPQLLIADEPTTALDVTVQREILDLLFRISRDRGMSLLLVSHDLGVIRSVCDRVAVMYAGQLVEVGSVEEVIERPRHPYTRALLAANPGDPLSSRTWLSGQMERFDAIPGSVPSPADYPTGCRFRTRCASCVDACSEFPPVTRNGDEHEFHCWNPIRDLEMAR